MCQSGSVLLEHFLAPRNQFCVPLIFIFFGALANIFILYPTNEFVYFEEYRAEATRPNDSTVGPDETVAAGVTPRKTMFYAIVGVVFSVAAPAFVHGSAAPPEGDLTTLLAQDESGNLEFKSCPGWDLRGGKVNCGLDGAILNTLAGYRNGNGGTLLTGVADDGSIVGAEHDCQTLKKHDRDGFEQLPMTALAAKVGGDACRGVPMVFPLAGKQVRHLIVMRARRPVYLKGDRESPRLHARTGVSVCEPKVQEAIDYTSARWPKRADRRYCLGA